ncbi:polyprenol phosphomannose-dependent alpha 1,6 mannosyltransferase MptB [Amycolatopsis sp. NPDC059657]|uniref:polyprenol phosphomannose-dependent alpha 1,6 mannosyltransferase MptB n=1 Tax=Amycolatopsis sp. NPDC059657 TaxID=3346899 RepID=UPI003672BB19
MKSVRSGDLSVASLGLAGTLVVVLVAHGVFDTPAVGLTGMAVVVTAWLLLGRRQPSRRRTLWTLALWGTPLLFVPPFLSGDLYSYLAQGELARRGLDPYATGPAALGQHTPLTSLVSPFWQETPSPYGPVFTLIERFIVTVSDGDVHIGVTLCRLLALGGIALIIWAVPRLATRMSVPAESALWLSVLNPLVLWHFVGGGHNDALMVGLALAGFELVLAGAALGMPLLCLAANVKVTAIVAVAVAGVELAKRRPVFGTLTTLGTLAAITALASWAGGFGWVRTLATSSSVPSWLAPTNWPGFADGSLFGVGKAIGAALAVSAVTVLLWRQWQGWISSPPVLGLGMAVVVVCAPSVQPWYLLWAVVPLAAAVPVGRARTILVGVVVVFALVLPPVRDTGANLALGYLVAVAVAALIGAMTYRSAKTSSPRSRGLR